MFGDGAAFLNSVAGEFGAVHRVTPLDGLFEPFGLSGGHFQMGVRVRRALAAPYSLEMGMEFGVQPLSISTDLRDGLDATAASFTSTLGDILSPDARASVNGSRALAALFARRGSDDWEVAFGSAMMVAPQIRVAMFSRLLDNDAVLASIRVPTLVVHGRNDRIVKVSAAQHTANMIQHATLLVYPGVGHAPMLDEPEATAAIDAFLKNVD